KLNDDTPRFLAADLQRELLVGRSLGVWPVRYERQSDDSGHFVRLDAQDPKGGAVGADKARFQVFFDVGNRGFLVQISQLFLVVAELSFEVKPSQFSGGVLREDAKSEKLPRFLRHRAVVEGCDVAENRSFGITKRHSQKTFDSPHARVRIVR